MKISVKVFAEVEIPDNEIAGLIKKLWKKNGKKTHIYSSDMIREAMYENVGYIHEDDMDNLVASGEYDLDDWVWSEEDIAEFMAKAKKR